MKYIIHKSSRSDQLAYRGPTCERADVRPGKLYDTESEAVTDAHKLSRFNGVGFNVSQLSQENYLAHLEFDKRQK